MSDSQLAVLGGWNADAVCNSLCEALVFGEDEHWEPLPYVHEPRACFAGAAMTMGRCIIVAGGHDDIADEVYDEVTSRWLQLPCCLLPIPNDLTSMGSALL